jgi:opacity protein-like surface antigen
MKKLVFALTILFFSLPSLALVTEIGIQYGRKKTSFDADNYTDSESITGSLSFYFMEKLAVELSYTDANAVREEKVVSSSTSLTQTVVQKTTVLGADLIFVLMDRKAFLQPYIKGGMAQITRRQEMKINTLNTIVIEPETATVPSYGAGLKIAITDTFGIKLSYDAWQTPIGGGTVTNDSQIRAGISLLL